MFHRIQLGRIVRNPLQGKLAAFGGYEPITTPFTEQGEQDLTRAVVNYLQGWH